MLNPDVWTSFGATPEDWKAPITWVAVTLLVFRALAGLAAWDTTDVRTVARSGGADALPEPMTVMPRAGVWAGAGGATHSSAARGARQSERRTDVPPTGVVKGRVRLAVRPAAPSGAAGSPAT